MRVFLKHILRSIRKHPTQPLLIIVAVALSVCVGVTAFCFRDVFLDRENEVQSQKSAKGDILITLSKNSEERMLFYDDAKDIVRDRGKVLGEFAFVAFCGEKNDSSLVSVSACDLEAADEYFKFKYAEYGRFTTENFESSAIITQDFAKEQGIGVGDTVDLSLLNIDTSYTVQAVISDESPDIGADVIVAISGAVKLLAQRSPIIASLGDEFEPYSRIMVRVYNTSEIDGVYDELAQSVEFSDDYVNNTRRDNAKSIKLIVENVAVTLMAVVLTILAAIVIIAALSFLSSKRETEYAQFAAAGASPVHIASLKLCESVIYAVIGGGIGILLSRPAFNFVASLFDWFDGSVSVGWEGMLFGAVLASVLMPGCTLCEMARTKKKDLAGRMSFSSYPDTTSHTVPRKAVVVCSGILFSLVICLIFTDVRYKYIPAIAAVVCAVISAYLVMPSVIGAVASAIEKACAASRRQGKILTLAAKSVKNNSSLKRVGCLLTVMLSLILVIYTCSNTVKDQYTAFDNTVKGEIVSYGISDEKKAELKESNSVVGAADFYIHMTTTVNGEFSAMTVAVSGDVRECMKEDLLPDTIPTGDGITVSRGLAMLSGVEVGDTVELKIEGVSYSARVSEIHDAKANVIFADAKYLDVPNTFGILKLAPEADQKEVISSLEADGVITVPFDKIEQDIGIGTAIGFVSMLDVCVLAALLISLAGCINMLAEQIKSRHRERELLTLCGMTKKDILLMNITELICLVVTSAVFALLIGGAMCLLVNAGVHSFGCVLF